MYRGQRLLAWARMASRLAVWAAGIAILLTTLLITYEVLTRKLLGISTGGADELSGYALAIASSWSLSFTLLRRAHVRVDAIHARLRARRQAWLDCLSVLCLTAFAATLCYFCTRFLLDTIALNARSTSSLGVALWIPQLLWVSGLALFALTCVLLAVLSVRALLAGDVGTVRQLVGSRGIGDEISDGIGGEAGEC
ncbi:MAG: TRAP transporter small permease [Roseovarius sp.]